MIDTKQEFLEYHAIDVNDIVQNGSEIPDNIRNSIILYNKALESLKTGSEDIAIIGLKKAVSMNPHFYEAMNLLGLCYSYINDNAKALEIFSKVVKAENNSIKALRYMSLLDPSADNQPKLKVKKRTPDIMEDVGKVKSDASPGMGKKAGWRDILKIAAGFSAGIILAAAVSMNMTGAPKTPGTPATGINPDTKTAKELENYKSMYNDLEGQYVSLQDDKKTSDRQVDYYKSVIKLYGIERPGRKQTV